MSIFEVNNSVTPEVRASRQIQKVNQEYDRMVQQTKTDFRQFWQNVGDVTPVQTIEAMGTKAQAFFTLAYLRVQMLVQAAQLIGKPDLITEAELLPPYVLEFNQDGSLKSATPVA
jgi:hypothetical protein